MTEAYQPAQTDQGTDNNSTDDGELITKFAKWDRLIDDHWSEWYTETDESYDFVACRQWAQEVLDALDPGRIAVTFNRVAPTIDAVSGAEIMGRQQVIYEPRQVGAAAQNEALTKGADWVRDECDAEHEESEAARDCLICGVGWTETRMDYDEEPDGKIVIERVDPGEMGVDPLSRKANFADARFIRRRLKYSLDEFEEKWPDAAPGGDDGDGSRAPVVVDPAHRYEDGTEGLGDDEVMVTEWQWYDTVTFHRLADPADGTKHEFEASGQDVAGHVRKENALRAQANKPAIAHVQQQKRVYYRAFCTGQQILEPVQPIKAGGFTFKAMTGKRDRNKGWWYGLVRPMKDPQRFANKFFSQIINILNSNAKGGILAEEGAFKDARQAEETWADPTAITWLQTGALSSPNGPKVKIKDAPAYPQGQDRLMQLSVEGIQAVTGVNQEMLGLADREQPGVLEHQRKQAAYGILSAFFDAFRRYRKMQGRLLLQFMQFLPPDYLFRIVGEDGSPAYQAIGTAFKDTKFTVIVDDTPAGPNEKTQTWQMIVQLMPMLQQAELGPEFWAEIVPFSPFPTALATKLQQQLQKMAQTPPPGPTPMEQADMADKAASAQHHVAQANRLNAEAGAHPPREDAATKLDLARTAEILTKEADAMAPLPDPTRID